MFVDVAEVGLVVAAAPAGGREAAAESYQVPGMIYPNLRPFEPVVVRIAALGSAAAPLATHLAAEERKHPFVYDLHGLASG